jgi:hypothetical protein
MRDLNPIKAERAMQPKFRIGTLAGGLVLLAAIALFYNWLFWVPNRTELGWRTARIDFRPVALDPNGFGPLRLAGAWKVTSGDKRFGGISALVVDRGQMLALTDSAVVVRFGKPDERRGPAASVSAARIGELPTGPGEGLFKRNRDSEVLFSDGDGRGWWVAFENRHSLWLYDREFGRALRSISLLRYGWRPNRGIEGAAVHGGSLLLFADDGVDLLRLTGSQVRRMAIGNAGGQISDAVAISPGQVIAIERRLTLLGFRNALVTLEQTGAGYWFGARIALPVGPIDNLEAVAVERLADGKLRLWLMSDDNHQRPLRTLLIALDWPAPPTLKHARRDSPDRAPAATRQSER